MGKHKIGVIKIKVETDSALMLTPDEFFEEIEALEKSGNLRNEKIAFSIGMMFHSLAKQIEEMEDMVLRLDDDYKMKFKTMIKIMSGILVELEVPQEKMAEMLGRAMDELKEATEGK